MVVTPVVVGHRLPADLRLGRRACCRRSRGSSGAARSASSTARAARSGASSLLDVWEWTPLIFLILLAGLQSLPQEPFEAARVDGAGAWRTFVDHTLPMLAPVLVVAIVLRTIDAFTTFDQVYVLTHGGPGTATQLISIYGYDTFFRFQQYGYAAAMLLMVALVVLACAFLAVRLMRRQAATA